VPDGYHRDTPAGNDHLVLHHLQRLNPLVAFAMHKQLLLFIAALTFSATARAEASLADLIFMMPKLVLMGIYNELARPWLLAGLWGAAALFWRATPCGEPPNAMGGPVSRSIQHSHQRGLSSSTPCPTLMANHPITGEANGPNPVAAYSANLTWPLVGTP